MDKWSSQPEIFKIYKREIGDIMPGHFAHSAMASEDLILRLKKNKELESPYDEVVNCATFNADGRLLLSASDHQMILLWDWEAGNLKLPFDSGHSENVYSALFLPYSGDKAIVMCGADKQVRLARLLEGGSASTELLAHHEDQVINLAVDPGSPFIFYSAGRDGVVQHFDLRTKRSTKLIKCRWPDFFQPLEIISIAIDPRNPNRLAAAGDDEFVRVYDIRRLELNRSADFTNPEKYFSPQRDRSIRITSLAFSNSSEILASYCNDFIYLFTDDHCQGLNPFFPANYDITKSVSNGPKAYKGHLNTYAMVSANFLGPNCEYIASGSDCTRLFVWRKKDGKLLRAMDADAHLVSYIEPHPFDTVIATCGLGCGTMIWTPSSDERAEPAEVELALKDNENNTMHVQD